MKITYFSPNRCVRILAENYEAIVEYLKTGDSPSEEKDRD